MLQPLQIKDVAARHAGEISELQDFFQKADCVLGTAESLPAIVQRLQRDRAFHRDLTSYLWVVIHLCHGNISFADLLGVLAIAAAGVRFAAEADEDDAHALLRFVMEARQSLGQSLDGTGEHKNAFASASSVSVPVAVPQPAPPSLIHEQAMPPLPAHSLPVEFDSLEENSAGGSRRRLILIAACVLAALSIGLVLRDRIGRTAEKAGAQPPVAPVAAPAPANDNPPSLSSEAESAPASTEPAAPASASGISSASRVRNEGKAVAAKPALSADSSTRVTARSATPPAGTVMTPAAPAVAAVPSPAPRVAAPGVSAPLTAHAALVPAHPAAPAGKNAAAGPSAPRLGVPSAATNATPDFSNTVGERHAPRLLHRTPEEKQDLAMASRTPDTATRPGSVAVPEAPRGTVRANSVGVHAANVLYSPIPAYPAAAAAAHVQGEVKLETDVNREGNIVSVRVVSGPPLLRAAALDAAQRWRYRPDKIGSQSIPISTVTVFDFQLP